MRGSADLIMHKALAALPQHTWHHMNDADGGWRRGDPNVVLVQLWTT